MQQANGKDFSITDRANLFLIQNKNSKTIKLLRKYLNENPINEEAWLLLGIAYRRLGDLNEAIKCFEAVVDLNYGMEEAWGLLTITYLDLKQISEANNTMERAKNLNPDDEKIDFYSKNLIRVYQKFGPFF